MNDTHGELHRECQTSSSQQLPPPQEANNSFFDGDEDKSPPWFDGGDDGWPVLSSSGELPNRNDVEIRIVSVPSTPESNPNDDVSTATKEVENLGFSREEKKGEIEESPSPEKKKVNDTDDVVVVISRDDDDKERENGEEVKKTTEEKMKGLIMADSKAKNMSMESKTEEKSSYTAMECLIEVLKEMCEIDDKKGNENVDILETAKRRGMTFPRNRGYDS